MALKRVSMPGGLCNGSIHFGSTPAQGGALTKHKTYRRCLLQRGFGFGDAA